MTFTEDLSLVIGAEVLDEDVAREGKAEDKQWLPIPKLGCLVKDMKIKSLEEIHLFFCPLRHPRLRTFPWA